MGVVGTLLMKSTTPGRATPERTATDERLRSERERTDDELARRRAEHDEDVDRILGDARERMDQTVEDVRRHAAAGASGVARQELRSAEAREDVVRTRQRKDEDEKLSLDRAELEHGITTLFERERSETDERLTLERIRADASIGSRDDILGAVSHDLRGMLAGVAMSASLLSGVAADAPQAERVHREARRIERYVSRMSRLIGDLLDVTRLEAGKLQIIATLEDPALVLEEAFESHRPLAAAKNIEMSCHVAGRPLRTYFDGERILQVLGNLIGNAIKFTPEGGRIELRLTRARDEVSFDVVDTGRGIPEDAIATVFDRFAQSSKENRSGLGLGLYISRRIIEAHGGRIWVESQVGRGSAFHVSLPTA